MPVSVVIPARDATATLPACLAALQSALTAGHEVIVVDDGSRDETADVAARSGARVVRHPHARGPAAARNTGVRCASGDLLLFLDADVCVHPDTVQRVVARFARDPKLAAVFGSYDDSPPAPGLVSRFKNLFHHFVHQQADGPARTFWGACGAVRRDVFERIGGFNERYREPSIEDIELGHRMHAAGYEIRLDRDVQVTHLKRWTLGNVIATDVKRRAIPWGRLVLREPQIPATLNLTWRHRATLIAVYAACLGAAAAVLVLPVTTAIGAVAGIGAGLALLMIGLNHRLYRFFLRREGVRFTLGALPLHALYCFYSGVALVWAGLTMSSAPKLAGSLSRPAGEPADRLVVERNLPGGPTRIM